MRMKALTTDTSLRKSTPHKLILGDSKQTGFVMIQEGETIKYLRISTAGFPGFEDSTLKSQKVFALKACQQVNTSLKSIKSMVVLESEKLAALGGDKEVLKIVRTCQFVLTDTNFNFEAFVNMVEPIIEQDADNLALAQTSFVLVDAEALTSL